MSSNTIPFDSDKWEITAQESKNVYYLGRKSLFLNGGLAILKDVEFTDGVIEYDVAFKKEVGVIGAVWRFQDSQNHEVFYMRPHQSGNPDATQYMPVFNDQHNWQLYHEEGYTAAVEYAFDQWMHVKIIFLGKNAEVYIQDMDNPVQVIPELKRDIQPGKVGVWALNFLTPAYFANFSYQTQTEISNLSLKREVKELVEATPGTIMSWWISHSFDGKSLLDKFHLSVDDKEQFTWYESPLLCEHSGLANLSRIQGVKEDKTCAFARTTIVSEKEEIKRLKFGFSDFVKVYFNGQLLYGGDYVFLSRDYKFLGSIGYFDELYLPLKQGENELWFAVSEDLESGAGWGLQAKFDNYEGLLFK